MAGKVGKEGIGIETAKYRGPPIRASMSALPIQEKDGFGFTSQNRGVIHACIHGGYTAVLPGAAKVLSRMRKELAGEMHFREPHLERSRDLCQKAGWGWKLLPYNGLPPPPAQSMIFVRSKGGINHNPAEWTSQEDCAIGCRALYYTVLGLGKGLAQEEG